MQEKEQRVVGNIKSLLKCFHFCQLYHVSDFGTTRSIFSIESWKFASVTQHMNMYVAAEIIEMKAVLAVGGEREIIRES